jgi:Raf kinase inhibitor-like YbhB/YbcL family protein
MENFMENYMENNYPELVVKCKDLENGEIFPIKYTRKLGFSPEFTLKNLFPNGKSITIIFDDLDQPMNHWMIWNIPILNIIPENIPDDKILTNLENAKQKSRYKGPNPPKGIKHEYKFNIYVLDCELKIKNNSKRIELIEAMEGHIIQYGFINGFFE